MAVHLPYLDVLLRRLAQHHPLIEAAYGRHVHWGYWADPALALQTPEDYAQAAEALAREICGAAQITDGQKVLDVGCGFGGTIASLNEHWSNLDLFGINIDERQLQRARHTVHAARGNSIKFLQGDACTLPLAGGTCDRVLAVECIFHFPDRERFFAEAFRVLKPGGYLALSDFVPQGWYAPIAGISTGSRIMHQVFGRCALCTLRGYRRLARDSGFVGVLERDVTAHTLPTYAFMRALAAQLGGQAWDSTDLATRGIELISRIGALRYHILAFRKLF